MKNTNLSSIEQTLETTFAKAPKLPDDFVTLIVTYIPILVILGAIFSLLSGGILSAFSIMFQTGLMFYGFSQINTLLNALFSIIVAVILFRAYAPLKAKSMSGWHSLFYLSLIVGVFTIVMVNISGVIATALSLYILFSIKPSYK